MNRKDAERITASHAEHCKNCIFANACNERVKARATRITALCCTLNEELTTYSRHLKQAEMRCTKDSLPTLGTAFVQTRTILQELRIAPPTATQLKDAEPILATATALLKRFVFADVTEGE